MADWPVIDDISCIAAAGKGSVIAAAGCGKTDAIVQSISHCVGRRLVLTHTHAGTDAIKGRLKESGVDEMRYRVDTIAGWCLRYVSSYPKCSGFRGGEPRANQDWAQVYESAVRLIASGVIDNVIRASYCGLFVDEYQDCSRGQHDVVVALSRLLPACVFGDRMQAIFDFGQVPVDWDTDVSVMLPPLGRLVTPWRWKKVGNEDLAVWLGKQRERLEAGRQLDFNNGRPECVRWKFLPSQAGPRAQAITAACLEAMELDGRLVVIADSKNVNARPAIAKRLAKRGFSTIEPIACPTLFAAARKLDSGNGKVRLDVTLKLMKSCMLGMNYGEFLKALESQRKGGRAGLREFGNLAVHALELEKTGALQHCLSLFEGFSQRQKSYLFRRELIYAMRSALRIHVAGESESLSDALWSVRNRARHAGRNLPKRSVGSTLLVKGLEFEHAIVVHSPGMTSKHWYVALTRATKSLVVLSPSSMFRPAS